MLFLTQRGEAWADGRGPRLLELLGRALATVAPWEFPGFEPALVDDVILTDPFLDPQRFVLFLALREEEWNQLVRREQGLWDLAEELGEAERRLRAQRIRYRMVQIDDARRAERGALADPEATKSLPPVERFPGLADYRSPSTLSISLAADLRSIGEAARARELSERTLAALRAGVPGLSDVGAEWTSSQLELSIASSYMDENRPQEAERKGLEAVRRLEALENTLARQVEIAGDTPQARIFRAYLEQTRTRRSNALLSLAVNANVRMKEPDRALGYFERAFELDQSDFMRVLLSCYRARSGRLAEARSILGTVEPSPPLYYNLACTYALLGDADLAIDYLQREFRENHPTAGSLRRQKEWASEDPDLGALREDPRFQRLVAVDTNTGR
jgi:tetratricopeptide (TPR) repeat protein